MENSQAYGAWWDSSQSTEGVSACDGRMPLNHLSKIWGVWGHPHWLEASHQYSNLWRGHEERLRRLLNYYFILSSWTNYVKDHTGNYWIWKTMQSSAWASKGKVPFNQFDDCGISRFTLCWVKNWLKVRIPSLFLLLPAKIRTSGLLIFIQLEKTLHPKYSHQRNRRHTYYSKQYISLILQMKTWRM